MSGLNQQSWKLSACERVRGFESHRFRHNTKYYTMGTVINMQQYKLRKHNERIVSSIANTLGQILSVFYNFFLEYFAYPMISAYASIKQKKVVIANYW